MDDRNDSVRHALFGSERSEFSAEIRAAVVGFRSDQGRRGEGLPCLRVRQRVVRSGRDRAGDRVVRLHEARIQPRAGQAFGERDARDQLRPRGAARGIPSRYRRAERGRDGQDRADDYRRGFARREKLRRDVSGTRGRPDACVAEREFGVCAPGGRQIDGDRVLQPDAAAADALARVPRPEALFRYRSVETAARSGRKGRDDAELRSARQRRVGHAQGQLFADRERHSGRCAVQRLGRCLRGFFGDDAR